MHIQLAVLRGAVETKNADSDGTHRLNEGLIELCANRRDALCYTAYSLLVRYSAWSFPPELPIIGFEDGKAKALR